MATPCSFGLVVGYAGDLKRMGEVGVHFLGTLTIDVMLRSIDVMLRSM